LHLVGDLFELNVELRCQKVMEVSELSHYQTQCRKLPGCLLRAEQFKTFDVVPNQTQCSA